jgi:hypothetical protein
MVQEGKKTPSRPIHLMLVGAEQAASAFAISRRSQMPSASFHSLLLQASFLKGLYLSFHFTKSEVFSDILFFGDLKNLFEY